MNFRQFLEMRFLQWQQENGGRRTVGEFAQFLDIKQQTVSSWWNSDRLPQGDNIRKLADKLGLEVYDVLGLPRPDARMYLFEKLWNTLTDEEKQSLVELAQGYVEKENMQPAKRKTRSV